MLAQFFDTRALTFQSVWGSGGEEEMQSDAGIVINNESAFEIVAFFSAVSLISDTISTLPVDAYTRKNGNRFPYRPKPLWVDQPDIDTTRQAHYGQVVTSLLVAGNSYTRIFRDRNGEPVNLLVLNPLDVTVERTAIGRKVFRVVGEKKLLTTDDVIHILDVASPGHLCGISRVEKLKNSLGVASALQSFAARFFSQGATASGIIEFPGNLTLEQSTDLAKSFDRRHQGFRKAHRTGVLSGGAKFVDTSVPNDQAQFIESRRFMVEEIARAFNIPPHMLGVPDSASYASVEQNNLQFISHTLRPILEKIEWSYSRLLPTDAFIKFNFSALLRGDLQSRAIAYSSASNTGWMSVNDIRRLEDMPSIAGGDEYRVPLANVNLSASNLPEQQGKVDMAVKLIAAGFDPDSVVQELQMPPLMYGEPTTTTTTTNGTAN